MLSLSELKPYKGSVKRRKIVGRGLGSGHGTYSGRGAKGQKARSGASIPLGFEGGRMPLHRQIPKKRGFTSKREKNLPLNLTVINEKFNANEIVNPKILVSKGLAKFTATPIKILGGGELTKPLTFEKVMVSASAKEKIETAGGKVL